MPDRPFSRGAGDASARRTYELLGEPVGADYRALLQAASGECTSAVLTLPSELGEQGSAVVSQLAVAMEDSSTPTRLRLRYDSRTVELLGQYSDSLYGWRQPRLPESLCLFRADGSPWLISVAPGRVGYVELSVLERARLSHTAPGVASALVNRGARDAVLGTLEHRLEERVDTVATDLYGYVVEVGEEHREVLCAALGSWLASADDVRAAVAVELARRAQLTELSEELHGYAERLHGGTVTPPPLADHAVLRDRWLARRLRLVEEALAELAH